MRRSAGGLLRLVTWVEIADCRFRPGKDDMFTARPMPGKTINIKTDSRHESVWDISPIYAITISS
jgi:hypothetical protein